jgi:anti-sigma B factor antagonist
MLLDIEQRRVEPDITVVELAGRLALGRESQRIETLVEQLASAGERKVILDMGRIDYIDSAGIGLVALAAGKIRENGGRVIVVAPEGRVLHLLRMTQMNTIVTVVSTSAEATAAFA